MVQQANQLVSLAQVLCLAYLPENHPLLRTLAGTQELVQLKIGQAPIMEDMSALP